MQSSERCDHIEVRRPREDALDLTPEEDALTNPCDAAFTLGRETATRVLGAACLAAHKTPEPSIFAHEDRRVIVDWTISKQAGGRPGTASGTPDGRLTFAPLRFRLYS